jgi:hypothetical protein
MSLIERRECPEHGLSVVGERCVAWESPYVFCTRETVMVEYVRADQLQGAVDLVRELSERWSDVRVSGSAAKVTALGDAVRRARELTEGQ